MNDPKPEPMEPLAPGALALRFRLDWVPTVGAAVGWHNVRQVVRGMECVEVIQQDGDRVRWTNHRPARKHGPKSNRFVGVSDRRELIALSHLETLLPAPRLNVPRSP